jgi:replicative DNA helicase
MAYSPDRALQSPMSPVNGVHAPPHNLEAEQSVLGAILLSERSLYALVIEEGLRAEDFYRERYAVTYAVMLKLYAANEPIDPLTVTEALRQSGDLETAGGESAIDELTGTVPLVGNARRYAQIVKENALLRRLLTTTYEIQASVAEHAMAPRDLVEQAEKAMLEVAHDDRQQDFRSIDEILHDEIDKMQRLSAGDNAMTGTPSGFKDLDELTGGFQPGNLIILAARPSMGKCLRASTVVVDNVTGRRRRIDELVAALEAGDEVFVSSLGPDFRLRRSRVSAGMRSGVQKLYRLTTKLGRRVDATANHPLLTIAGWRELGELGPGDRIAVPRRLPTLVEDSTMPDAEIVLLAALIADGSTTNRRTPTFHFGAGTPMIEVVRDAAAELGVGLNLGPTGTSATLSNGRGSGPNPATELCRTHGIWDKRAEHKAVPDAIFRLADPGVARFLGVLFACDGHIHANDTLRQIGYTTISERLAHDVQHLLLRLGVVSMIRTLPRPVYDGTGKVAREVLITGQADIARFAELIAVPGKLPQLVRAVTGLQDVRAKTNVDTLPSEAWTIAAAAKSDRSWASVSVEAGCPRTHNWHVGTRGLSRSRAQQLGALLESPELEQLAASDVWWDEVASIEYIGEEETYDLTVPGDHSFVADDVIVHNSALVTNIAENAAIDHGRAVALFSLEMSETELAQRFVASQGRIFGDKLRKGKVADSEWPKILDATKKLSSAPLYVDDSSDIGILDIRAKARRLHQQAPNGLGLIIVDYLQLMRPDAGTDSRVEQVGQMSRGLKILARELKVPVIALSQLSRAVETRHDKKPILSDLRESGQIEQDADLVMFIYRDEYYEKDESEAQGLAEILIAKHRNGGLGDVTLTFRKEYPKFLNYAGDRYA